MASIRPTQSRRKTADSGIRGRVGLKRIHTAKKPKARPPQSFRDKIGLLHGALPTYSGPYAVGIMEIEVPVEHPRTFYTHKESNTSLRLETVLMAIYYPAALGTGHGPSPDGSKKWSRQLWLPRPRSKVAKGYGKFAGIGAAGIPLFLLTTWFTKLPAFRSARLADYWPPPQPEDEKAKKVWDQEGAPPQEAPSKPIFPLMIFSHGLGGSKTSYSSLCGEFASYGFVVCAIEHRDGSGARTFVNREEPTSSESDSEGISESSHQDYIYPPDNPYDTSPGNEKGIDSKLRKSQLMMRLAEISESYSVLKQICQGDGQLIAEKNLRRKGGIGASSRGLNGVHWDEWKDRIFLDNVTMLGHSFGASTTIEVLRSPHRFDYIGQGIIYDIWAIPIKRRAGSDNRIQRPLLAINSEAFMYWLDNFEAVTQLVNEAKESNVPAWSLTIRGSVHISQSDFTILYPNLCAIGFGMTVNPRRALDLNVGASLEFLQIVRKARAQIIDRTMKAEGLLKKTPIDEVPEEHKPAQEKHLALKIEVPHQFKARARPRLQRILKRVKNLDLKPIDELWVHLATDSKELRSMGIE